MIELKKELIEAIDKSEPTRENIVATAKFKDAPVRHFIVAPCNKEKIVSQLRYITKATEVRQ